MTITIDQLVQREVHQCLSSLVSTLAQGWASPAKGPGTRNIEQQMADLEQLHVQAAELCYPLEDYEEALLQEGYEVAQSQGSWGWKHESDEWAESDYVFCDRHDAARDCIEVNDLKPHTREIFEHWAVSRWLAEKLQERGERIDLDFAGMCVWGRTNSGQGIAQDAVIRSIYEELVRQ